MFPGGESNEPNEPNEPVEPNELIDGIACSIDALGDEDRSGWATVAVGERLLAVAGLIEELRAVEAELVGEFDARGGAAEDGARSTTAWLAARTPRARAAVARSVAAARFLRSHPDSAEALAGGHVAVGHVEVLARAERRRTALFADHEHALLDAARACGHDLDTFATVGTRWSQVADEVLGRDDPDRRWADREVHLRSTTGGAVLSGFLPTDVAAVVHAALTVGDRPDPNDAPEGPRTAAQRRADRLGELAHRWVAAGAEGNGRPITTIDVVVDAEVVAASASGTHDHGWGTARRDVTGFGPVPPAAVERLLCDSWVGRVVTAGAGEVIEVGRRSRTFTAAQARAIRVRHPTCAFWGCAVPAGRCDLHHIVPAGQGGPTDLANGLPVCRRHHVHVHELRWRLDAGPRGAVTTIAPDGRRFGPDPP